MAESLVGGGSLVEPLSFSKEDFCISIEFFKNSFYSRMGEIIEWRILKSTLSSINFFRAGRKSKNTRIFEVILEAAQIYAYLLGADEARIMRPVGDDRRRIFESPGESVAWCSIHGPGQFGCFTGGQGYSRGYPLNYLMYRSRMWLSMIARFLKLRKRKAFLRRY